MRQKAFSYPYHAKLHDIDAAGAMFFASYFRLAHDAYEDFMTAIGFGLPALIRQGQTLPLVHSSADFLQPVRHGDSLQIQVRIARIGDTSFSIDYLFVTDQGLQAARLQTRHVLINPENRRPLTLPEPLRQALQPYSL
jgi:YbgC/YbaW family acyl-CoA thioester hydrolase